VKIKNFIFLLNLSVVILLSVFLFVLYKYQQNVAVEILIDDLKKDLLDSKYVAVKFLNDTDKIYMLRPYFDREIARNPLIRGFLLKRGEDNLFISGDVDLKLPLHSTLIKSSLKDITLNDLLEKQAFYIPIKFFSSNEHRKVSYKLYVFLNKTEIISVLNSLKIKYFLIYFVVIVMIFILINYLTTKYLVRPLMKIKRIIKNKKTNEKEIIPIYELEDIKNLVLKSFEKFDEIIKKLRKESLTDSLTGLGNKKMLLKKVNNLISKEERFCLVFIDLDNIKQINDYYGHTIGDEFIKKIADKLRKCLKEREFLSRIGGDEFILILKNCQNRRSLEVRLYKLLELLEEKIIIGNYEIIALANIGVAVYPEHGNSFEELLKNADMAMYQAKHLGKNKFVIFNNFVKDKVSEELRLISKLKKAFENEEFVLYYQPKIDKKGKIFGAEVLIRWIDEDKIIYPKTFIPLIEQTGLICEIGNWVAKEVIKNIKEWEKDDLLKNLSLFFNVSFVQMRYENFLFDIQKLISFFKTDTSKIGIEVSENVFQENKHRALYLLGRLKKMGFNISLDDFGRGESSLSLLKDLEIDFLKIDNSFINAINNKKNYFYVKSLVEVGKNFNIKILAEGVETEEQFKTLKRMGINYYQGYYIVKPMEKKEFIDFVRLNKLRLKEV